MDSQALHTAKWDAAAGALLIFLVNLSAGDLLRSFVLAGIGALASYTVSRVLRWLTARFRL